VRRLYIQIYLAFVAAALLFAGLVAAVWIVTAPFTHERRMYEGAAAVAQDLLPPVGAPRPEVQAAVDRLSRQLLSDITVRGADGVLLAAAGKPLPLAQRSRRRGWIKSGSRDWTFVLPLPDGRWLLARHRSLHGGWEWLGGLLLLAIAVALAAFPVARRITRRLERLRSQVDEIGAGGLSKRVDVDGRDEVAALARSFNQAADRIEHLLNAQRSMLASASHELRSPLARLRLAFELLGAADRPELKARVERDIRELDDLIDELLLASRLEAVGRSERRESVDLLALVAEEASRWGFDVGGAPAPVNGDARMLRRLVRNLFENARRYGSGAPVEASVGVDADGTVRLRVMDRGPGVPPDERERIFEPFYRLAGSREDGAGVGLGLALVRQIAHHHGGEVRCLPRDGGGTCFEVVLPNADSL
jgi:signal transduction histidine kinase